MTFKIAACTVVLLITTAITTFGQTLPNEEMIFSFDTQNGKTVTLSKDKKNKYLIYRFGTKTKVEFEFPRKSKESWSMFNYSYALRGGGKENAGIDLNYVYFTHQHFTYVIYDTYFAEEDKQRIGVKVINLRSGTTTNISGNIKTRKGILIGFREDTLITRGGELFD